MMYELVKGALDLHVHPGPDVQMRKVTDLELSHRMTQKGMGGFAIKSHYLCTAERAKEVNAMNPKCRAIGAITLNNSVGGLNPVAAEIAARAGAKIIWLPSVDSRYEREFLFESRGESRIFPYWVQILKDLEESGISCPPISLLTEAGGLRQEMYSILEIAKAYQLCIATSHISHEEAFAVAEAAHEMRFERLLISHVLYPSTCYDLEERKRFLRLGALLEYSYSTFTTKKTTFEATLMGIREIGPQNCIISSDLGMPNGDSPEEGLYRFSRMLFENGIPEAEIHRMNRHNPAFLTSEEK
ncbi:MAG: DUF6282 family protein [Firmicutes bacterium]|nr:DUF6282 family protein [Bacillota bacterium]